MEERILTPSQLNREAGQQLRHWFGMVWLEGEISNFTAAGSGHWYFTLKDDKAQVRCAMFRNRNLHCALRPANGMQVQIRAQVGLYEARGEFQLVAEQMREAGLGELYRRYQALKEKLQKAGLFAPEHKRPLPRFPQHIAVVTSARGAALQDVRKTLQRRWPQVKVTLIDTLVQGEQAAAGIVAALQAADALAADTVLLVRGGGSLEDLWAFNEEQVVRAVFELRTPIVAAIGHETDTTLAELAADLRAATPTAAAEQATPDRQALQRQLAQSKQRLKQALQRALEQQQLHLGHLDKRLQQVNPHRQLAQRQRALRQQALRLRHAATLQVQEKRKRLQRLEQRLQARHPAVELQKRAHRLATARLRLRQHGAQLLPERQQRFARQLEKLNLLNPLHTLERGYSITLDAQGRPLYSVQQVRAGERIQTRLADGSLLSRVDETKTSGRSV